MLLVFWLYGFGFCPSRVQQLVIWYVVNLYLIKQDALLVRAHYITLSIKGKHITTFNSNVCPRDLFTGCLFHFQIFFATFSRLTSRTESVHTADHPQARRKSGWNKTDVYRIIFKLYINTLAL